MLALEGFTIVAVVLIFASVFALSRSYLSSFVHFSRSLAGLSLAGRREQRRKKKSEGLDSKTEGMVREGDREGREQGRLELN